MMTEQQAPCFEMTESPASSASQSEEQVVTDKYETQVLPFWLAKVKQGEFEGEAGVPIYYAYALRENAVGSVAISSGRVEALVKYKEVVFDLYQAGYSVFIHDHRGQGQSGRMTCNSHKGYVLNFDDYVTDFKQFYDRVITPNTTTLPHMLCHSMGSAIGALYLLKHPKDFAKVVFCAPMFGIRPAMPDWLASSLINSHLRLNQWLHKLPWYFWGQKDYQADSFSENNLTHSESRYRIFTKDYADNPEIQLGGVTGKWLLEAYLAMKTIALRAEEIKQPVLMLQAGDDSIVDNNKQNLVAQRLPQCDKRVFEGAFHEILMEKNSIREPAIEAIKDFLAG